MNEQKKAEIEKQARGILGNFAENLKKIKIKDKKMDSRLSGFREEGDRRIDDNDFRERILKNAPCSEGDFIIAEKKTW